MEKKGFRIRQQLKPVREHDDRRRRFSNSKDGNGGAST